MLTSDRRRTERSTGSTRHPDWLFDSSLSLAARYVYVVLLSHLPHGHDSGAVSPAVKKIAAKAKMSERAAYNALWELRDAGLVTIGKRPGAGLHNQYAIHEVTAELREALCRHSNGQEDRR